MPVDAVRDVVSNRSIQEPRPRLVLPDALHGGTQATGEGVVELQELPYGYTNAVVTRAAAGASGVESRWRCGCCRPPAATTRRPRAPAAVAAARSVATTMVLGTGSTSLRHPRRATGSLRLELAAELGCPLRAPSPPEMGRGGLIPSLPSLLPRFPATAVPRLGGRSRRRWPPVPPCLCSVARKIAPLSRWQMGPAEK
jgi:hypothetical protein